MHTSTASAIAVGRIAALAVLSAISFGSAAQQFELKSLLVDTQSGASGGAALQQGDLKRFYEAEKLLVYQILAQLNITKDSLPQSVREAIDKPQTTSFEAFAAFARGVDLADQGRYADARDAFNEAVRIDPGFGLAQGFARAMPPQNVPDDAALGGAVGSYNARATQDGNQLAQTALADGGLPVTISGGGTAAGGTGAGTPGPIPLDQCQVDPIYCFVSGSGAGGTGGQSDKQTQTTQTTPPRTPSGTLTGTPQAPQTYAAVPVMVQTNTLIGSFVSTTNRMLAPYVSTTGTAVPEAGFTIPQLGGGSLSLGDQTPVVTGPFTITALQDGSGVFGGIGVTNPTGALAATLNPGSHTVLTDSAVSGSPANYLGEWYPLTVQPGTGGLLPTQTANTNYAMLPTGTSAFGILISPAPLSVLNGLASAQAFTTYTYNQTIALQGSINLDTGSYGPTVYAQPITAGNISANVRYGAGGIVLQSFTLNATGPAVVQNLAVAGPQAQYTLAITPIAPTAVNANGSFVLNGSANMTAAFSDAGTDFTLNNVSATGARAVVAGQIAGTRAGALLGTFAASGGTVTVSNPNQLTPLPSLSSQGVFGVRRP